MQDRRPGLQQVLAWLQLAVSKPLQHSGTRLANKYQSNPKVDKQHECHGGSYYDYHRDCCACTNTEYFYFKSEKTCQPCGPNSYYDYKHNREYPPDSC